jgi:hypothetical protein
MVFKEEEVWYILISVIAALSYLQLNNLNHGEIGTKTIFLTPNKEKVKVLCQFIGSELQSYKEFYE